MRGRWRMMNRLFISGNLKKKLFRKSIDFEMIIIFSITKKQIIDIVLMGNKVSLEDKRFNIDFEIGDHIDKAKKWISDNKHKIDFEKNKN